MLQFKPVFLGQAPRRHARATTSQKCIRTNDIENVGVTARHHTFFEMLGNFSFGDYFKEDAIAMAWDLATRVLGIPADRVWVSVYEDDDEAARLWTEGVGLPPHRVQRLGAEDNFWASGPTGPCGPCSELYYDLHPERGVEGADLGDDSRFIEFYNLVFMESNRAADGTLTPLAAQNIDTGMGLERVAQILQGVPNNYETDLIFPLVRAAADRAGVEYGTADERTRTSLKVIGDHARACAFLISDGVTPSNVGRGYVLRRLLRRVVMKGRLLGIDDVFTPDLAAIAADLASGCDPGLAANLARVQDELRREEERFTVTLEAGKKLLEDALAAAAAAGGPIPGDAAFELYDTYGFPLEVTVEAAGERGVAVDEAGFAAAMAAQKARSKAAAKTVDLTAAAALGDLVSEVGATRFVGYEGVGAAVPACGVVALLTPGGERVESAPVGTAVDVLLEATPFYGEGGGQVGDTGVLTWPGGGRAVVTETRRAAGGALFVHRATVESGELAVGEQVRND
jgi:alanyl-tRNA synthetase